MGDATWSYLDGRVLLHPGDCRERIRAIPDASIDAVVTDPPYALVSIGKRFGKPGAAPAKAGTDGLYARASAGFMGQQWDTGETAFAVEFWTEVLRVLKPGGHIVAFSGTRTYHRMAVAIEDAGFEIRDQLGWAYGSGFPKSHDVSKGIDKAAGIWRGRAGAVVTESQPAKGREYARTPKGAPVTDAAKRTEGLGTAIKPAWEPIAFGRKPLAGTVAENVLEHGPGALNIDGCRLPPDGCDQVGRWPANILHDGSDEVVDVFGEASRFFYSAKADADDRIGSKHPTVKPVDLMRWLCRLVTPPGGTILDPFAGTGTTGEAAFHEGFQAILIEREEAYQADIARRMELAIAGPMTRRVESIKARGREAPADDLFTSMTEAAE
jgi:DNA modification methylase